jgi:hypothetical protein
VGRTHAFKGCARRTRDTRMRLNDVRSVSWDVRMRLKDVRGVHGTPACV